MPTDAPGGRRRGPRRRARVHRHPQPLRLHAAGRPARRERDPPGRDARGRRQLRLRLLPDPRSGARAQGDLRLQRGRADRVDTAGGYFERLERARPAVNVLSLVPNGQLRLSTVGLADRAADAPRHEADAGAARGVARRGRLGVLDRARVRPGGRRDGGGGDRALPRARPPAPLRDAHAPARRGAADSVAEAIRPPGAPRCRCRSRISSRATGSRRRAARRSSSSAPGTGAWTSSSTCTRASTASPTSTPRCRPGRSPRTTSAALLRDPSARDRMRPHRSLLSAGEDWGRVVARQPVLAAVRAARPRLDRRRARPAAARRGLRPAPRRSRRRTG